MADLLYLRHSTDKQTNARQTNTLAEYMAAGAPSFEDPATSSRIHALKRDGFRALLDQAAVGDTVRVADAARLFRSVADVIEIRQTLQRRGLHLRVAAGAWSGMDLAADDAMTKLFVTMLAGVLEFQRDMISENVREGLRAAESNGKALGRPRALDAKTAAEVVKAHREGTAIKALARRYGTSPKTIRRALDDAGARTVSVLDELGVRLGDAAAIEHQEPTPDPDRPVVIDVPGLLADHLQDTQDAVIRDALHGGKTIRRGQGYSVRVTAPLSTHHAILKSCSVLTWHVDFFTPAARKAHHTYRERIAAAAGASSTATSGV